MTGRQTDMTTGTATCPFSLVPRRVVLDTNVLVSLWIFADSRYAPLRAALEDGRWQALTSDACCAEFERVLDYPQFAVVPERQRVALMEYRRLALTVAAAPPPADPLPRCKDPDDQKFLELARDGKAQCLVTADRALLVLARRQRLQRLQHLFRILTPDAALTELERMSSM